MILLAILAYTVKECVSYKDLECYQAPGGECKFSEVGIWWTNKKIDDVKVSKGSTFWSSTIGNANLENLPCDYIPRIFHYFKNLQQLFVKNCGLMKLKAETFQEATIGTFIAIKNDYPKIEDKTFSGAGKLEDLHLKWNKIREISEHAFTDCQKLKIVDLSENEIQELTAGSFDCPTLENLNLERNKIEQIKVETFLGAASLETLILTHNEISAISDDGFKGLTNLQVLRLGHNKLTHLRKKMLEKMENLKSLFLVNNKIEVLDADTFQGNPKLNEIFIQNNQLKAVADGTFDGLNLKQLHFVGNSCARFMSPNWNIDTCIEEYNIRYPMTTPSTTTNVSTIEPHNETVPKILVITTFAMLMFLILIVILLILIKRFSKTGATHNLLVSSTSGQGHGQNSSRPSELIYADLDMARVQSPATSLMSTGRNNNLEEAQYATIQDVSQQSVTYASIGDFAPVVPRHLKK
jgi:hypothetical protein